MKTKLFFPALILFALVVSACAPGGPQTAPPPPAWPEKADLESSLAKVKVADADYDNWFVFHIQQYCVYTAGECETRHVWLGQYYGYDWASYSTIVSGEKITVGKLFVVHMSYTNSCPGDQKLVHTFRGVTAQGVLNANQKPIHAFCIER